MSWIKEKHKRIESKVQYDGMGWRLQLLLIVKDDVDKEIAEIQSYRQAYENRGQQSRYETQERGPGGHYVKAVKNKIKRKS